MTHNPSEADLKRFGEFVHKSLRMLEVTNYEEIDAVVQAVATLVVEKFDHPILLAWALYAEESALKEDLRGMVIGLTSIMCGANNPRDMEVECALLMFNGIDLVAWTRSLAAMLKDED